jgi:cytochrome c
VRLFALALVAWLAACGDNEQPFSVIVFTRQNEWNHTSNPIAAQALQQMAIDQGWLVQVTDDPAVFTNSTLDDTSVVIFSVVSGNILDDDARANLERFFRHGGGFVGIHSASSAEFDWPFYGETLVPVAFKTHPTPNNVQMGTLDVLDPDSPIMRGIPNPWLRADEFYTFWQRPEDVKGLHLLNALDEASMGPDYPDDVRVGFHPLTFWHQNQGTRVFYTALGHTDESYSDPDFLRMLEQAIEWAGRG